MKQTNKSRLLIVYLIACMLTMYGFMPPKAEAASLINVKDTLNSSAKGVVTTHNISFDVASNLVNTDKVVISMPAGFNVASAVVTCPTNTTSAGFALQVLTCNVNAGIATGTTLLATIANVTNPSPATAAGVAQTYQVNIETQTTLSAVKERANAMVAIIDQVTMTATVDATLAFTIAGVNAGVNINGVVTTATTTATTTPFGTLTVNASSTVGQQLTVATNAKDGYTVTVQENQELTSNHGATINSFENSLDGTGSSTPHTWANPTSVLDAFNTYGHMGLTSDDSTLNWGAGNDPFGAALFGGFTATTAIAVLYHNGPANGAVQDKSTASVAYSVMVGPLQEAGDYINYITYVCTPQY